MRNSSSSLTAKVHNVLKDDLLSGYIFMFRGGGNVKRLWTTVDGRSQLKWLLMFPCDALQMEPWRRKCPENAIICAGD